MIRILSIWTFLILVMGCQDKPKIEQEQKVVHSKEVKEKPQKEKTLNSSLKCNGPFEMVNGFVKVKFFSRSVI